MTEGLVFFALFMLTQADLGGIHAPTLALFQFVPNGLVHWMGIGAMVVMAFAGAFFLPSAMLTGISRALLRGPAYIASFIAVFSGGQSLGGLLGSSLLGTFVTVREKFHANLLAETVTLADPQVVLRMRQLSGAYSRTLGDTALRTAEGGALIGQQITREAYVLAYADLFRLIMMLSLAVFLWLAFGSLEFLEGQIIGKLWMVLLATPLIAYLRRRDERLGLTPA